MRQITLNTKSKCGILIERGIVSERGLLGDMVITDKNVDGLYGNLIFGNFENKLVLEAGERSKCLGNYGKVVEKLAEVNPNSVVAFGGGVIGDLVGFAASTYKGGIEFVQVPTTLMAMVDSGIGGKNGVNVGNIKNCIGTIYQPEKILIDPVLLKTLPPEEVASGYAEIIKYFALFGKPDLKSEVGMPLISECCAIKARVVEKDEKDSGYRHILNLGHTVGHSIELLYGLRHGEAVAIGLVKELEMGEKMGLVERGKTKVIRGLLELKGLSTKFRKDFDVDKIVELMRCDKKGKGKIVFAFNEQNYNVVVDEKTVRGVLRG